MKPVTLIRLVLLCVVVALVAPGTALAATDDTTTVDEDTPGEIVDVLKNDDATGTVPNTAQIQDGSITAPAHGTATILQDTYDQVTYKPSANYCGPDSFSYTSPDYGTATVSVTVTCVDDPPLAANDPEDGGYHVDEDSGPVDYDVLANDTDIDGGPKLITALGSAERGTATLVGSKVRYAPTANLCGASTIRYTLNDSLFLAQKAALTVDADCKPDPPVANSDAFSVGFGSGTTLLPVVANDTDADDLNEQPAQYADIPIIDVTQPLNGTAQIVQGVADRTDQIAYTPRAGFCGTDSFAYRVLRNEVPLGQVTVTVACPVTQPTQPTQPAPTQPAPAVGAPTMVAPLAKPSPSATAGAPKVAGSGVGVPLSCTAAASCKLTLALTATTGRASAAARKKKPAVIGKLTVTLRPGQKRTVKVKLNAAGRRALKKSRKLKTKLVVKLGTKTVTTRTVTFKAARKR